MWGNNVQNTHCKILKPRVMSSDVLLCPFKSPKPEILTIDKIITKIVANNFSVEQIIISVLALNSVKVKVILS